MDKTKGFPTSEKAAARNGKTYLNVPYAEKEEARRLGARWDKTQKSWYVPATVDKALFGRWMEMPAIPKRADFESDFARALEGAGLVLDGPPLMDGKWHHTPVSTSQKTKALKGAYIASLNESEGYADGFIKNHDTNFARAWKPSILKLSDEEIARFRLNAEINRKARLAELATEREAVATAATKKWESLQRASTHPYLERKGVHAFGLRVEGDNLVTPLRDAEGKLWSLQYLPADKNLPKLYEKGGQKTGNFHLLGDLTGAKAVLFAEGYATAASLHMATGLPVVVAFDSGNLGAVAEALKPKLGDRACIVCGDDDVVDVTRIANTLFKAVRAKGNEALEVAGVFEHDVQIDGRAVPMTGNPSCKLTVTSSELLPGVRRATCKIVNEKTGASVDGIVIANVGREKALLAAQILGGEAVFPKFAPTHGRDVGARPSDFNDLHSLQGLEEVSKQLMPVLEHVIARKSPDDWAKAVLGPSAIVKFPEDNRRYVGRVVAQRDGQALQDVGKQTAVPHELSKLNKAPELQENVAIAYRDGRGTVESKERTAVDKGR